FITGHDAAMVTHALYVDNEAMTAEQLKLADVNGDGVVDQSDADWIHENQVYELGKTDKRFRMNAMTVYYQAYCIAADGTGNNGELQYSLEKGADLWEGGSYDDKVLPEVCYNLLDVNGDGVLTVDDILLTAFDVCYMGCGASKTIYFEEGRYDLTEDTIPVDDYHPAQIKMG
ncbi:MAG: dockerin type I domain-containing protein, partial [Ruminococcus callidus]